jgi:hypothetical protein
MLPKAVRKEVEERKLQLFAYSRISPSSGFLSAVTNINVKMNNITGGRNVNNDEVGFSDIIDRWALIVP